MQQRQKNARKPTPGKRNRGDSNIGKPNPEDFYGIRSERRGATRLAELDVLTCRAMTNEQRGSRMEALPASLIALRKAFSADSKNGFLRAAYCAKAMIALHRERMDNSVCYIGVVTDLDNEQVRKCIS